MGGYVLSFVVLDTHVWLWWLNDPSRLSARARDTIDEAVRHKQRMRISCISTWEVAILVRKGKLAFSLPASSWVQRTEASGLFEFVPVSNAIALRSVELEMHADPADRIIVATAIETASTLVTKDEKLQALSLPTLW